MLHQQDIFEYFRKFFPSSYDFTSVDHKILKSSESCSLNYEMALSLVDVFSGSDLVLLDVMRHHYIMLAPYLVNNKNFKDHGGLWASYIDAEGRSSFLFSSYTGLGFNCHEYVNLLDPEVIVNDFSKLRGENDIVLNHSVQYNNFLSRMQLLTDGFLKSDWDLDFYFENVLSNRTLQNSDDKYIAKKHPQVSLMSSNSLVFSFVADSCIQHMAVYDKDLPVHPYFSAHIEETQLNKKLIDNLILKGLVDERYNNSDKGIMTYGFYEFHKGYMFNLDSLEEIKTKYALKNPWLARRIYYIGDNVNGNFVYGKADDLDLDNYAKELVLFLQSTNSIDDLHKIFRYICNLTKYMILYSHFKCYTTLDSLMMDFSKIVCMALPIKRYIQEVLKTIFDAYLGIFSWNTYDNFRTTIVNGGSYVLNLPDFFELVQANSEVVDVLMTNKELVCGVEQELCDVLFETLEKSDPLSPDICPVYDIPVVDLDCYYKGDECSSEEYVQDVKSLLLDIYSTGIWKKNPGIREKNLMEPHEDSVFDEVRTKVFYYGDNNLSYRSSCLSVVLYDNRIIFMKDLPSISTMKVKFFDSNVFLVRMRGLFLLLKIPDLSWSSVQFFSSLVYGLVNDRAFKFERYYYDVGKTMENVDWFKFG